MCVVCGCAETGATNGHDHSHDDSHVHQQPLKAAAVVPDAKGDLHFGAGAARVSVPGMSQARAIKLETDILGENNRIARHNRQHFEGHGVTALNLVSSPGSGKTTLLCATIEALKMRQPDLQLAVIEGDQQTSFDADRIRATGAPAVQINTGKGCHLDAPMVAQAFAQLHAHAQQHDHGHAHDDAPSLLFIENVGNLVCPAVWDLGEAAKVAILSVTEGEDKPLKYPDMFAASTLMVLNKIDLLPHVRFDVARCIELARRVNPTIQVIQLSATTGEGMSLWLDWLAAAMAPKLAHQVQQSQHKEAALLQQRVAELEAEVARLRAQPAANPARNVFAPVHNA